MAKRILIVGKAGRERDSWTQTLIAYYELSAVENSAQCVETFDVFRPHVILLDVGSGATNDYELCQNIKSSPHGQYIQIIVIYSRLPAEGHRVWHEAGADDYLVHPFDQDELLTKVSVHMRLGGALQEASLLNSHMQTYSAELERLVHERTAALEATQDMIVFALARLADSRDQETGEHLDRIRIYSQILARQLSETGPYVESISAEFLEDLYRSSSLHDIGKVGIPDSILLKPDRLTPEEFEKMKTHTVIGAETLEEAVRYTVGASFLKMAADIARHHHERFDGSGYPNGLKGGEIPLSARIVAVADVYDALTSERVYKKAISPVEARQYILEQAGKHFDPAVVTAFMARFDEFAKVPAITAGHPLTCGDVFSAKDIPTTLSTITTNRSKYLIAGGEILLATADKQFATNALAWLKDTDYHVRHVTCGRTAVEQMGQTCPHFLIAERGLPGIDGLELVRRLRRERLPHYVYTVLVSHDLKHADAEVAFEAGVDDLLFIPASKQEICSRIRAGGRLLQLLRELSDRPRRDPLTGVATRRLLDDQLSREWRRARRYRMALSCVVIDIDHFGKLNEEHGATVGDTVLTSVAALLRDNCRATDYVFRRGADSFCVVLGETNEYGATVWAERVGAAIAGQTHRGKQNSFHVTASFGIAQLSSNHSSIDDIIDLAEQSQVVAKQVGGNRTIRFSALGDTEKLSATSAQQMYEPFRGLIARDIMSSPIMSIVEHDSSQQASEFLVRYRINSAPVVDQEGRLVGIVSEKDLMKAMASENLWRQSVRHVMTRDVISYDETFSAYAIYKFLLSSPIRRVVVVKGSRPTGVISRGSLLRCFNPWNPNTSSSHDETEPNMVIRPAPVSGSDHPLEMSPLFATPSPAPT